MKDEKDEKNIKRIETTTIINFNEAMMTRIIGNGFTRGFYAVFAIFMFIQSAIILYNAITFEPDETNDGNRRSGMVMYTDYGTGCQYLKSGFFAAPTPRMNYDGKQICLTQKELNERNE